MKNVYILLIASLMVVCVQSCTGTGPAEAVTDVLASVSLSENDDNVLRFDVDLKFKTPCSFRLEYWEASNPESKRSTREYFSRGNSGSATLMFLKPSTDYLFSVCVTAGGRTFTTEKPFDFSTRELPIGVPTYTVAEAYPHDTAIPGYILHGQASSPTGYLVFTDTDGNVVWYQDIDAAVRHFTFDPGSGTFVILAGFKHSLSDIRFQRFTSKYLKIDLFGNILEEKTAGDSWVAYPHHDIKLMPGGELVVLHSVRDVCDLTALGGGVEDEVYWDGFTVFGTSGETVFEWNTALEFDPVRDTYLNTMENRYDIVHANSVSWDSEGNWYFTLNNLNELWKIDGKTGKVLYRVGDHGNVSIPDDAHTSGIHSSVPLAPDKVLVLDNGSRSKITRALVYEIDATAKTASVALSVPIPAELSSTDRSNCEILEDQGMIFFGSTAGKCCLFTDMDGNILKVIRRSGISYRTHYFRKIEY